MMYDRTMRIGDLVVVTHKEIMGDPDDRYFGILVREGSRNLVFRHRVCFSVVCNRDGKRREFHPNDWDVEVINASR